MSSLPAQSVEVNVKEDRYLGKIKKAKRKARSELELDQWNRCGYRKDTPKYWEVEDHMERIHHDEVSVEEFIERFENPGLPVVIRGATADWSAPSNWKLENLVDKYGQYRFKCGEDDDGYGVYMKFKYYVKYAQETDDDSPLYIFDSNFGDRIGPHELLGDYSPPKYFRDDLFRLVGEKKRPPYRWVVIGPPRSGTNIHIDPLGTSAWNTLISGHKRWALFPPTTPKSLVDPPKMEDEAVVWFNRVYPQTLLDSWPGPKPINIIQRPGETVFVPGGWWHVVMNLDLTVAITQNFCSQSNFEQVWLKARSARPKFSQKLAENLQHTYPHLYNKVKELAFVPNFYDSSSSSSSSSSSESEDEKKGGSMMKKKKTMGRMKDGPNSDDDKATDAQMKEASSRNSESEGSEGEKKERNGRASRRKEKGVAEEEEEEDGCLPPEEKKRRVSPDFEDIPTKAYVQTDHILD